MSSQLYYSHAEEEILGRLQEEPSLNWPIGRSTAVL